MLSRFSYILFALSAFCIGVASCNDPDDRDTDAGADSDSDIDTDTDTDADSDTDTDTGVDPNDKDGDGFSPPDDCDDNNEFVNPMAIEDLGDAGTGDLVDNDCDGETDEEEDGCDCTGLDNSEAGLQAAIDLCDARFVVSVTKIHTSSGGDVAFDTLSHQGSNTCILPTYGCEMAVISTGPVGQPNPNQAQDMGGMTADISLDPITDFMGNNSTTSTPYASCDVTQIEMTLIAPTNALGFSFDSLFGSAEYDEWINLGYNDAYYAIVEDANLNGGATTNIVFDDLGVEVEVDNNFFENASYPCDETGSGWEPAISGISGSTGWLRTTWGVVPGTTFQITFSIHDEGDCVWDSIAFIDNFTWSTQPVEPGTDPIIE